MWPQNLMLETTWSHEQFDIFMQHILIYVKYYQKALNEFGMVLRVGKNIFQLSGRQSEAVLSSG